MSADYPNRQTWLAVRGTTPIRERPFYSGGTYVRARGTAEDVRLAWYQRQCNGNAQRIRERRRALG